MNKPTTASPCDESGCGRSCSVPTSAASLPKPGSDDGRVNKAVFRIDKMDCPTEEALIRKKLEPLAGVVSLEFNLMQRTLAVRHTLERTDPVVQALREIEMIPAPEAEGAAADEPTPERGIPIRQWVLMGIAGATAVGSEIVAWTTDKEISIPVIGLALISIVAGGSGPIKKGWTALRNLSLNMNLLMSVAVIGAAIIGKWPEAAVVIWLFALAEMIERMSLERARNAIRGLRTLAPDRANLLEADGSCREVEARIVEVGRVVRVNPGERIPLDGIVTSGRSAVNQAPITGESVPVEKQPGDPVFAGTINETGSFDYRVTSDADDSTLARIIHAVEEAQASRAPTQRFVDGFARIYTPAFFGLAVLVAAVPPALFGQPVGLWVYRALVLLVIGCPCALVISTPVTVVSGLAAAARHGILIKGGAYLEGGRKLRSLALDKTGTVTLGKPAVTDVRALGDTSEGEAIRLAAALAARSDHPVSGAVLSHVRGMVGAERWADVQQFEALAGRGIAGTIDGLRYHLGNHRLLEELHACNSSIDGVLSELEEAGKTVVILVQRNEPLAIIGVADTVRETSREAVSELKSLGVHMVMLTGDNPHTARVIARAVGIQDARGNLLPEDKLAAVGELRLLGDVGMVGDGINDAPALAKATIGFAMGAAGTDTALETADVALMDDDLRKIPWFIRLSRRMNRVLVQNIVLALGIKAVFFGLALTGHATLWMAVFADMGASLIVVFNGLRLLSTKSAPLRYALGPRAVSAMREVER